MAQKEGKKKRSIGKKSIKSIGMAVLIPIMIIVMVCGLFFAIIDGIIGIITGIITSIADFLSDPIQWFVTQTGKIHNWVTALVDGEFSPNAYADSRDDPTVVIGQDQFKDMQSQLENAVNRNTTGLNDIMLKKMMLTYYRGVYLSDTNILMEITDSEEEEFNKEKKLNDKAFDVIDGDEDEGKGKDGKKYLQTKGMVTIENNGEQLVYYPKEVLQKIYEADYVEKLKDDKEDFAKSVKEYLTRCYTNGEDGSIQMYAFKESKETEIYEYDKEGIKSTKEGTSNGSAELTSINYSSIISQYTTPVEFLVNLMEITGSKDFIDAVIELTFEDNYVKLGLYEIKNESTEQIKTEYDQKATVKGKKDNIIYTVKREDNSTDGLIVTEEKSDQKEKVNIKVTDEKKKDCSADLYINNKLDVSIIRGVSIKNFISLNEDNNWTSEWKNLDKPDQSEKSVESNGKTTVTQTTETTESKYDVCMIEAKTWYSKVSQTNTTTTLQQYSTKDKDGKEFLIENKDKVKKIIEEDEENNYSKDNNPKIINYSSTFLKETTIGEDGFLNSIYNYTIEKDESVEEINYDNMNINKTNITKTTLITNKNETLSYGVPKTTDNTDDFLGLLSNETGEYVRGAKFKSKKAKGKVVKYDDLYNTQTGVGELLVNGAEMLFELLDSTYTERRISNTQGLSDIMRYILWRYSGIDYGVTEFNFTVMGEPDFSSISSSIVGNGVEEKVWFTLKAQGYSDIAVAGIMGNIEAESEFDPKCVEEPTHNRNRYMSMVIWKKRTVGKVCKV